MKIKQKFPNHVSTKFVTSASRNDHHLSYDDLQEEPFLLTFIKDTLWYFLNFNLSSKLTCIMNNCSYDYDYLFFFRDLKSLFVFLIEQPSQLKYIEWPSFSNTVCLISLLLIVTHHNGSPYIYHFSYSFNL